MGEDKNDKHRVLIIGGSGFIGQHVVARFLSKKNVEVGFTYKTEARIFQNENSRGDGTEGFTLAPFYAADELKRFSVRSFQVDVNDMNSIDACIKEFMPHAVIHLAGT
eukprot:g6191.t1